METKRLYAFHNHSGQWWTGACWGVEQAREEYENIADVPRRLGKHVVEFDDIDSNTSNPAVLVYENDSDDAEVIGGLDVVSEWDEE